MEKVDKKEWALNKLRGYYQNPETCGYDLKEKTCKYLTDDGKMCIAGSVMLHPGNYKTGIYGLLSNDGYEINQHDIFKKELVDVYSRNQWSVLQRFHDTIATEKNQLNYKEQLIALIKELSLFTEEEFFNNN